MYNFDFWKVVTLDYSISQTGDGTVASLSDYVGERLSSQQVGKYTFEKIGNGK